MINNDILLLIALFVIGAPSAYWLLKNERARWANEPEVPLEFIDFGLVAHELFGSEDEALVFDFAPAHSDGIYALFLDPMHDLLHVDIIHIRDSGAPHEIRSLGLSSILPALIDASVLEVPVLKDRPSFPRLTREPKTRLPNRALPMGRSSARPRSGPRR